MAGINASLDLIRRTRGGSWPSEPVTLEGNYVDLVWHEAEFRDGKLYTYVLTDPDHGYIGCLYLYPLGVRRPLTAEMLHHDVDVSWWVTPAAYEAGLYPYFSCCRALDRQRTPVHSAVLSDVEDFLADGQRPRTHGR